MKPTSKMVGAAGFSPATFASQTRRSRAELRPDESGGAGKEPESSLNPGEDRALPLSYPRTTDDNLVSVRNESAACSVTKERLQVLEAGISRLSLGHWGVVQMSGRCIQQAVRNAARVSLGDAKHPSGCAGFRVDMTVQRMRGNASSVKRAIIHTDDPASFRGPMIC